MDIIGLFLLFEDSSNALDSETDLNRAYRAGGVDDLLASYHVRLNGDKQANSFYELRGAFWGQSNFDLAVYFFVARPRSTFAV